MTDPQLDGSRRPPHPERTLRSDSLYSLNPTPPKGGTTATQRRATHAALAVALLCLLVTLPALRAESRSEAVTTSQSPLPIPVYQTSAAWDGARYGYIFGGLNAATSGMNTIFRYDAATDSAMTMATTMPTWRISTAAVWDPQRSRAYVLGGDFQSMILNSIMTYDPATNTAFDSLTAKLPCEVDEMSAVFDGKNAYLFGGEHLSDCQDGFIEKFDPSAQTASLMNARFPVYLGWSSAVWDPRPTAGCASGCAYIFGGWDGNTTSPTFGPVDTIYRYNPATDTLSTMHGHLPTARYDSVAAFDGTRAYVLGGNVGGGHVSNEVDWYDPITDTVGIANVTLPKYNDEASGVWADGRALIFGGGDCDTSGAGCVTSQAIREYVPPPLVDARFTLAVSDATASADARASTAVDASITSYDWSWGDGATGSGLTATHAYAASGTYTVSLTIRDDAGRSATSAQPVTVTVPATDAGSTSGGDSSGTGGGTSGSDTGGSPTNQGGGTVTPQPSPDAPPLASFASDTSDLNVTVDASASSDSDGTITQYAWDMGDGSHATGVRVAHAYANAGTYRVTLTVTDNAGLSGMADQSLTVTAPPASAAPALPRRAPPTASFNVTTRNLTVDTDASMSNDPNGSITHYAWTWGDGATAQGMTATHTYNASWNYSITLTVTNDANLTASMTRSVNVTTPPPVTPVTPTAPPAGIPTNETHAQDTGASAPSEPPTNESQRPPSTPTTATPPSPENKAPTPESNNDSAPHVSAPPSAELPAKSPGNVTMIDQATKRRTPGAGLALTLVAVLFALRRKG